MIKGTVIWVGLRLTIIYGLFYLIGWFTTLDSNLLNWTIFDEPFHRGIFAVVFLLVTAMVIGYSYDNWKENK